MERYGRPLQLNRLTWNDTAFRYNSDAQHWVKQPSVKINQNNCCEKKKQVLLRQLFKQ